MDDEYSDICHESTGWIMTTTFDGEKYISSCPTCCATKRKEKWDFDEEEEWKQVKFLKQKENAY